MFRFLQIKLWHLACRNNKGNIVEKYHRLLNKTQAIAGQYHGIHYVLIQNKNIYHYMWNSNPINDANVMRSIADAGR